MNRYKRLTEKDGLTIVMSQWSGTSNELKIYRRLAELEDKIENCTLVELPCNVGEIMYEVVEGIPIQEWKIESICFNRTYPKGVIWAERTRDLAHWKFWIEDYGTKWFATKAEAEKRLDEIMKGGGVKYGQIQSRRHY